MKLNKIFLFLPVLLISIFTLVSCEDDSVDKASTPNDLVSFGDYPQVVGINSGETIQIEGKVYATTTTSSDRVINLQVISQSLYNDANPADQAVAITTANPDYFSVPATVTIPAGSREGVFQVSVTGLDLYDENGVNGKRIVIGIVPSTDYASNATYIGTHAVLPTDVEDFEVISDRMVLKIRENFLCSENHITVQIFTDGYGEETSWELYDADLVLIASGGPYATATPGGGETRDLCLADGHYVFVAYDAFGDGMNDGTNAGYYKLSKYDAEGTETVIAQNGTFATDETVEFDLP
ncbi:DUF1735 domain-containing protein [Flavobacterium silvaticum]|uniref:DUF1735 domain-containing protein n=1 Tax=Flavobacterium silvaticum TaxID=1852020 RepID=A0A972FQP2_9FLAO|nr:DUF1735 domain-containing protein [Flavobacterium silvaticum]NMH26708.1 DUF1735 domain-containing protein [Flavobacterium silvaticum]